MSTSDALPGCVSSMAFTAPGDEIWIAKRNYGIEVRAWPGFEMQRVLPVLGFYLAAHPTDPYMAVLSAEGTYLLDLEGKILRSWTIAGGILLAAAFLEDTLQLLFNDSQAHHFALWSCSLAGKEVQKIAIVAEPEERLSLWTFWAALLPRKKLAFLASYDHIPLMWRIQEGTLTSARDWAPKPEGSLTSWLSVDASSDERFLMWAYKGPDVFLVTLDDAGNITHKEDAWVNGRCASQAIHHQDEIAVGVTVDGKLFCMNANSNAERLDPYPSFQFAPGYRWDQK